MAFSNIYQNSFLQDLLRGLDNPQYISAHDLETQAIPGNPCPDQNNSQKTNTFHSTASNSEFAQHVSNSDRPLLPRPPQGNVCFNQGAGQCPMNFTIEEGSSNPEHEEEEEQFDELVETPQNSQFQGSESETIEEETGPNPAELHAFYLARAQQLQELADPLTIDTVPEVELLEIMTRAMQSLRRRHLL